MALDTTSLCSWLCPHWLCRYHHKQIYGQQATLLFMAWTIRYCVHAKLTQCFILVVFISAGLIVCCCINLSVAGGISVMYPAVVFNIPVMILKRIHAMFGALVFVGGMVTIWLGLSSTWFTNNVHHDAILALCFACPLVVILLVLVQVGQKVLRWKTKNTF